MNGPLVLRGGGSYRRGFHIESKYASMNWYYWKRWYYSLRLRWKSVLVYSRIFQLTSQHYYQKENDLKTSSDPHVTPFPLKHLCWQWRRLHEKTVAHRATKALETSRWVLRMPPETFWDLGSLRYYFLNFGDYFTEFWRIWSQLEPMHHCSCECPLLRRLSHRSPT